MGVTQERRARGSTKGAQRRVIPKVGSRMRRPPSGVKTRVVPPREMAEGHQKRDAHGGVLRSLSNEGQSTTDPVRDVHSGINTRRDSNNGGFLRGVPQSEPQRGQFQRGYTKGGTQGGSAKGVQKVGYQKGG
jgi:hypothetical protein